MRMTLDEVRRRFPDRPAPAPLDFRGQWVAWNREDGEIVAHGDRFDEVRSAALSAGCKEPLMQCVLGTPFVGGA
jgi:Family of unknown function (DUF5678)